jgi:hypothetical protein
MALTRKFLKALEIEDEKIDQIIEAHTDVTDALKKERDGFKDEAAKLADVQKKLDEVTEERDTLKKSSEENESYKEKYENEKTAFSEFKQRVDADKEKARKTDAYKGLLKKAGVSEKRIDAILKVPFDVELDDKGEVKGADKVVENIKSEWSDFIVKEHQEGAGTETPPADKGGTKMTKEQIMAIKDREERQQAISENHELFGY